jgi:uncharacterized protein
MGVRSGSLSASQARRIALRAQHFGVTRPAVVSKALLHRLLGRLGAIQIDSVNVLVRSQYLPAFSRLGAYDRMLLEKAAYSRPRRVFEYWGHEASLLPIESFPLFRWRMEGARRGTVRVWRHVARVRDEEPKLVARVLETIARRGPMSASEFEDERGVGGWWGWSATKSALEFLFWAGEITALRRRASFERVYDLAERVIPERIFKLDVPTHEAQVELLDIAAAALGVATEGDLRDYFRMPLSGTRQALEALVKRKRVLPVNVVGWKQPAYLHARATVPRKVDVSALLSPFDSLVWNRERTRRLFGFDYRIEIYTPAHRRTHGYYVLPYLLGEHLVGRVDLKADRGRGVLRVHAIHYESGVRQRLVRARLKDDLRAMADWLGLGRLELP